MHGLFFGAPGYDPHEIGLEDVVGVYYDLDHAIREEDFDARVRRRTAGLVQSINSGMGFRVY